MKTRTPSCPFEHIENPDLEARQIEEAAEIQVKLLEKRYQPPKPVLRGVHPKSHGCVKATFTVDADIAPEFQVGPSANASRHVRYRSCRLASATCWSQQCVMA